MIKVYKDDVANVIVIEDGLIGYRAVNTLQAVKVETDNTLVDILNKTIEDGSGGRVKELHRIPFSEFVGLDEVSYGSSQQEVVDSLNGVFSASGSSGGGGEGSLNSDFKPTIQDQIIETTEDASISYQIVLQGSNSATIYGSTDIPSWLVLDQKTGIVMGTSPLYTGTSGSGIHDTYSFTVTCASPFGSSSGVVEVHVAEVTNDMFLTKAFDMQYVDYLYSQDNLGRDFPLNKNTTLEGWSIEAIVRLDSTTTGLYTLGSSSATSSWGIGANVVNGQLNLMIDYKTIPTGVMVNTSDWWSIIVTCDATSSSDVDFSDHLRVHVRNLSQGGSSIHSDITSSEVGEVYTVNRRASYGLSNYWGTYKLARSSLWRGVLTDSDCENIFNHSTNSPNTYIPDTATFWGGWSPEYGTVFPRVEEYNNILDGGNPSPVNRLTMNNMTAANIITVTVESN